MNRTLIGPLAGLLSVICAVYVTAETDVITVNYPNPLSAVAGVLGSKYGVGISYEGPEYEYPNDLVDISRNEMPTAASLDRCEATMDVVARFCYFSTSYTVDKITGEPTNIVTALREIVEAYNSGDNPGKFAVLETRAGPSIVATAVKDRSGRWRNVSPLLSRPISVSVTNGTNLEAWRAMCKSIQALTAIKFFPITLRQSRGGITLIVTNMPARDVIATLVSDPIFGGTNNRWDFFYTPCPPAYGLQEQSTVKGYPVNYHDDYPWSMVGNVTHPDYRGERAYTNAPLPNPAP